MPSRLPRSKLQINFVPKAPQRCKNSSHSSLRKNSLAVAYKTTTLVSPSKEERSHGFEYFPLWLGIKALWCGIDWCFNQALDGVEAVAKLRKNENQD
jgi:hypothetical protein